MAAYPLQDASPRSDPGAMYPSTARGAEDALGEALNRSYAHWPQVIVVTSDDGKVQKAEQKAGQAAESKLGIGGQQGEQSKEEQQDGQQDQ